MEPGKILIIVGIILVFAGLFFQFGPQIPFLGKLPGDIRVERENFSFYFPIATSILVSVVLSFLLWLFRK